MSTPPLSFVKRLAQATADIPTCIVEVRCIECWTTIELSTTHWLEDDCGSCGRVYALEAYGPNLIDVRPILIERDTLEIAP